MIVTAALIWWNERPEDLERCVRGMATIADRLVAVDGAYARYPGARARSPTRQVETIRRVAEEHGVAVTFILPDRLWAGQVEKRSHALTAAAEGSDWVAVVDADWVIAGDREKARAELAGYNANIDVVSVPFYTPAGPQEASTWHTAVSETWVDMPHLFRALPEMSVEKFHWHIGARKGKDRVWMWGLAGDGRALLPAHKMQAPYRIDHLTLSRTEEQVRASRAFLNDRIMVVSLTGQEDDVPGLPPPEFDYETIPNMRAQRQAQRRMSARLRYQLRRQGQ